MKLMCSIGILLLISAAPLVLQESLQVPDMEDMVKCTDGTEVRGTVLCVGSRRVIVLVDEKEIELLPSEVASISKVNVPGELTSYTAGNVDGTLEIVSRGTGLPVEPVPEPDRVIEKKKPPEKKQRKGTDRTGRKDSLPPKITEFIKKYGDLKKFKKMRKNGELKKILERNADLLQSRKIKKLIEKFSE